MLSPHAEIKHNASTYLMNLEKKNSNMKVTDFIELFSID